MYSLAGPMLFTGRAREAAMLVGFQEVGFGA
jgi:hypothetical protein